MECNDRLGRIRKRAPPPETNDGHNSTGCARTHRRLAEVARLRLLTLAAVLVYSIQMTGCLWFVAVVVTHVVINEKEAQSF